MSDARQPYDVNPNLVSRYLRARGWDSKSFENGMTMLSKDQGEFEIFLNSKRDVGDKNDEVYYALRTISDYYGREISEIHRDVISHLSDRISSRIPDEYVKNDTIEFRVASSYISGMKVLLSSSATTEMTERRFFLRTLKEAVKYSESCRFAHTFRGSFGFVVESPVGVNNAPSLDGIEDHVPLERRVVERLSQGFASIQKASLLEDPSLISESSSGLSANMCDAIADLLEEMEVSNIKFKIDFSSEWRSTTSEDIDSVFKLSQNDVPLIRAGAKSLKVDEKPSKETIFGKVRRVGTDGNPSDLRDDDARREIEVNWVADDEKVIRVRILVTPEDYLKALDAHRNNKVVTATGLLPATGKTRWLGDHGGLNIING